MTYQVAVRSSADPQVRKQAQAVAEAMLDEVLLAAYTGVPSTPWPGGTVRSGYFNVGDYNGYDTAGLGPVPLGGVRDIQGAKVAALAQYNVSVTVAAPAALNGAAEARRVVVTVTGPNNFTITLDGYRVRYQ
jgi:MSHA pilin protein MshD